MSEKTSVTPVKITVASVTESREEWRPIAIGQGKYEVSNFGRVRRVKTGRILQPGNRPHKGNTDSYLFVNLRVDGKTVSISIHRLVASAFIPGVEGKFCIDHIDGNRHNNRIDNLRWVTPKENVDNPVTFNKFLKAIQSDEYRHKVLTIRSDPAFRERMAIHRASKVVQENIQIGQRKRIEKHRRWVKCVETGALYPTVKAAAEAHHVSLAAITLSCNLTERGRKCSGYYHGRKSYHFIRCDADGKPE